MSKHLTIIVLVLMGLAVISGSAFSQGWNVELISMMYQNADIRGVALQDNHAFLAAGSDGLLVVDVINPAQMMEVANLSGIGYVFSVFISSDYAYLECSGENTRVVDISNPENPVLAGSFRLDGRFRVVEGDVAYAAAEFDGIKIYDVSNPFNPVQIGSYDPPGSWINDLDLEGQNLYVACCWGNHTDYGADSLLVLDVSDPSNPDRISMTVMYGRLSDVEVNEGYAYFTAIELTFQVWDVSDPFSPTQVGSLNLYDGAYNLVVAGNFAYYTDGWPMGLRVIDVSNPPNPVQSGNYNTPEVAMDVAVNGDYAYVADADHFEVYNCSAATPADIEISLIPMSHPIQIPPNGGSFEFYLFATNHEPEVQLVDFWSKVILPNGSTVGPLLGPASVSLDSGVMGWFRSQNVPGTAPPGLCTYIACAGNYPSSIWATDSLEFTKLSAGDGGWVSDWSNWGDPIGGEEAAVSMMAPDEFTLCGTHPNPFNPSTTISFALPEAAKVNLSIYDVSGRLVTELINGWRTAGTHEITFDGSNLASGIYLYQLQVSGSGPEGGLCSTTPTTMTDKMVLMK